MSFVHLHVHSEYSVLDGLSKVGAIVDRAKELHQPAIALTDHGAMFGVIDFFNAARKAGVKPIVGMEGYLARRSRFDRDPNKDKSPYHLLLLAQNDVGYKNLLKLASLSQLEGFYYRPRVDKETLAQYNEGIIVTTGCGAAEIPRFLVNGQLDQAREAVRWYVDVFGRDRFFIELQMHDGFKELPVINRQLLQFAKEFGVRAIATNDAHYLKPEDAPAQDMMICIGTGSLVSQADRMRMTDNSYYLKSYDEMAALFGEIPEVLTTTLDIAEMCNVDLSPKGYHLPNFDLPPGVTADQYLRQMCEQGLIQRYGVHANDPEVRKRLDYELSVIHTMGFDTYFLIVADLTRYARECDIWWNIRGSGASSIVAYTSGITNLDPLPHKLIFERFLNPGRISMPDIDMDFPDDRRAEMINYAVNKYGKDKVAQIITFGTLGARAAIRDVGRALDIPLPDVDRIAKLVPNVPGKPMKLTEALTEIPELKQAYDGADYVKKLIDTAITVEGTVRNVGTHAAGVVISDKPLIEYTPLHRPTKSDEHSPLESITQFEMGVVDSIGLLKVDFLGLATLTIMRKACDLIRQNHGVELNLNNIPTNDPEAFALMSRGDVLGVFQVEGGGMRRMLMEMRPIKFEHIVAGISLFRPGPMEYIPMYIKRMHGEEPVEYKHPKLKSILDETYGIIVYQEQIIQIAVQLAGYKPGEADEIRKAVGKKIKEKIEAHRNKFIKGAVANSVEQSVAAAVYDDIEYFARYGFNKAHAADYAVMTCQTAYLKAHYPVEYMTALMTVEASVEKIGLLIVECRRMGIDVLRPDVNFSDLDFTIEAASDGKRAIRFGMASIKGVGEGPVSTIVGARSKGGPFASIEDFCRRVDLRSVNRRALEALIKVGALEAFGNRAQLLQVIDRMLGLSSSSHRAADVGQMMLFGAAGSGSTESIGALSKLEEATLREKLEWEKELIGAHVSEHPIARKLAELQNEITHLSSELSEDLDQHKVVMLGMVISARTTQTKKGDTMGFVLLEDVQGTFECVVFPRAWKQTQALWQKDKIILVRGTVDGKGRAPKILLDSATDKPQVTMVAPDKNARAVNQGSGIRDQGWSKRQGATIVNQPLTVSAPQPKIQNPKSEVKDAIDDRYVSAFEEDDPFAGTDAEWLPDSVEDDVMTPEPPTMSVVKESKPTYQVPTSVPSMPRLSERDIDHAPQPQPAQVQPPAESTPIKKGNGNGNGRHQPTRTAKVVISRTGDGTVDAARVGEVHQVMRSCPGPDRFCFIVMARGDMLQLDFPNDSTTISDDLIDHVKMLPGVESVQISLSL
jgi:DNA polymerase-3 subunit alpha